jgi:hypothetical protein
MIDLKVKVLGGKEIAAMLTKAESGLRAAVRDELALVGDEMVEAARARAPRDTGALANRIRWYFGAEVKRGPKGNKKTVTADIKWKDGRIRMTVRPFGNVAHLMERGVNATFQQRAGRGLKKGQKVDAVSAMKWKHAQSIVYQRTLVIAPRPFFSPAVAQVGGPAAVNARVQARIDRLVGALSQGRAA